VEPFNYRYQATVHNIVDGDTVDLVVDLGFRINFTERFRLNDINAPERFTVEGKASTVFLKELLPVGTKVVIDSHRDTRDKYGRWIATIYIEGKEQSVNDTLVNSGHAVYHQY
jgi:micrococcal nuclease